MNTTADELTSTMQSLTAAGRAADAAVVAHALQLHKETGEWVACLRCSLAFTTAGALHQHYSKTHSGR